MRIDGREDSDLREIEIETGYQPSPDGSALIKWGETIILCSASVEYRVPFFLTGKNTGWITAEYGMLPGSGNRRIRRDRGAIVKGRTQEIQRLIGRSLRQSVDLARLGERTITVDCDVLVADGGTRVASIVGGAVALRLAIKRQIVERKMKEDPFRGFVSGLSLGFIEDRILLDLCYEEDSAAIMDMNVIATETGELVELQASAEGGTVSIETLNSMTEKAMSAILEIVVPIQREATSE